MKLTIDQLPDDPKLLKEIISEFSNEASSLKEQHALLKQMLFELKSKKHQPDKETSQLQFNFVDEADDQSPTKDD